VDTPKKSAKELAGGEEVCESCHDASASSPSSYSIDMGSGEDKRSGEDKGIAAEAK